MPVEGGDARAEEGRGDSRLQVVGERLDAGGARLEPGVRDLLLVEEVRPRAHGADVGRNPAHVRVIARMRPSSTAA